MPSSRTASFLLAGLLAGAAAAGCSTSSSASTPPTSGATTAVAPATTTTLEPEASVGTELYVYAPVEGDCIDLRAHGDQGAATTRAVPGEDATPHASSQLILRLGCDLPHQYEVISVVDAELPPGAPADDETLLAAAKRQCPAAFATYVGRPYESSGLEVGWVLPTAEQRGRGSRTIGCLAFDPDGKLTGAVRGSGR
jgi:hypothetical protein